MNGPGSRRQEKKKNMDDPDPLIVFAFEDALAVITHFNKVMRKDKQSLLWRFSARIDDKCYVSSSFSSSNDWAKPIGFLGLLGSFLFILISKILICETC